jgi:hypothetical protein
MKFYKSEYRNIFRAQYKVNYMAYSEDNNNYIPKKSLTRDQIIEIEKNNNVNYMEYSGYLDIPELI